MTTYYDEQGNAVEAFSKEELEAQLASKLKENTPAQPDLSPVLERLQKTESALYEMRVEKYADIHAGNDAEKREKFMTKFGRLTGYEETANGLAERAKDAAKLAFDVAPTDDMSNLADAGSKGIDTKSQNGVVTNDAEKELQKQLGITDADIEKYGDKK